MIKMVKTERVIVSSTSLIHFNITDGHYQLETTAPVVEDDDDDSSCSHDPTMRKSCMRG